MLKANRIAQRLSACHTAEAAHQPASPANGSPVPEPMQVDTARLSSQERARRMAAGLCLYCASADHFIRSCPNKTPTSSGEYSPHRPCNFHAFYADCSTIHSSPICYSLCPGRLGLLGQLHLPRPPESFTPTPLLALPGAPSRDHQWQTARTWVC